MKPAMFWIHSATAGRLAIMPRPRGGDWLADEVRTWRIEGVDIVVSLLTADEATELDLVHEQAECEIHGIEFRTFPITDRSVPASKPALLHLASELAQELVAGKNIATHCRQGIGKAALVAICTLALAGMDVNNATTAVREARGCDVPETPEQKRWIADFARTLAPAPK